MSHKTVLRNIAAVVSGVYLFTNVAFAHSPQTSVWNERKKTYQVASAAGFSPTTPFKTNNLQLPGLRSAFANKSTLSTAKKKLPSRLVSQLPDSFFAHVNIKAVHRADTSAQVIILEDVHQNLEAQAHISQAIQSFSTTKKPVLVALEGAAGSFVFDEFKSFSDAQAVRDVADSFLETSDISGPAHAGFVSAANTSGKLLFWGVDDRAAYSQNVSAYKDASKIKSAVLARMNAQKKELANQKEKIFTPELKQFDSSVESYRAGALPLRDYVKALTQNDVPTSMTFEMFSQALEMEANIDFTLVEAERRTVIEKLVRSLGESDLAQLIEMSLNYQQGTLTFGDYYSQLRAISKKAGVDLAQTPAFNNYIRYVLLADGIDADKLFKELSDLENRVYVRLSNNKEQADLVAAARALYLTEELTNFALTPEQWLEYQSSRRPEMASFESFYQSADRRSETMVKETLAKAKASNAALTVLVAGGFHTEEMAQLLRKQNVSYLVATPKITKVEGLNGSAYLSVFDREKTPLDEIFAGSKLFVAPPVAGATQPLGAQGASAASALAFMATVISHVRQEGGNQVEAVRLMSQFDASLGVIRTRQNGKVVEANATTKSGAKVLLVYSQMGQRGLSWFRQILWKEVNSRKFPEGEFQLNMYAARFSWAKLKSLLPSFSLVQVRAATFALIATMGFALAQDSGSAVAASSSLLSDRSWWFYGPLIGFSIIAVAAGMILGQAWDNENEKEAKGVFKNFVFLGLVVHAVFLVLALTNVMPWSGFFESCVAFVISIFVMFLIAGLDEGSGDANGSFLLPFLVILGLSGSASAQTSSIDVKPAVANGLWDITFGLIFLFVGYVVWDVIKFVKGWEKNKGKVQPKSGDHVFRQTIVWVMIAAGSVLVAFWRAASGGDVTLWTNLAAVVAIPSLSIALMFVLQHTVIFTAARLTNEQGRTGRLDPQLVHLPTFTPIGNDLVVARVNNGRVEIRDGVFSNIPMWMQRWFAWHESVHLKHPSWPEWLVTLTDIVTWVPAVMGKIPASLQKPPEEAPVTGVDTSNFYDQDGTSAFEGGESPQRVSMDSAILSIKTVPAEDLAKPIKFGTAGWRAGHRIEGQEGTVSDKIDTSVTVDNVGRVAQAISNVLKKKSGDQRVAVGYDVRTMGPEFAKRVVEVLAANGIPADLIDQVNPSPVIAEATRKGQEYTLGVAITASHNEVFTHLNPDVIWSGMKVFENGFPGGDELTGQIAKEANDASKNGSYQWTAYDQIPDALSKRGVDLLARSNERLAKAFDFPTLRTKVAELLKKIPGLSILIDSMHGATLKAAAVLLTLGISGTHLNVDPVSAGTHPRNLQWSPNPTNPAFYREFTAQLQEGQMGFLFDGDGDRAVVRDIDKSEITPNMLGVIFAHYLYHQKGVRGKIVRTLPTSRMLDLLAKKLGVELVETPVGSKNFAPYGDDIIVAVEESGHIFFKLNGELFVDSAVAEAVLALDIFATTGKSLKEYYQDVAAELEGGLVYNRGSVTKSLVDEPFKAHLKALRVDRPEVFAQTLAAQLGKELRKDRPYDASDPNGVLVLFADETWAMYRLSGTDGSVRIYGEEKTAEKLAAQEKAVQDVLVKLMPMSFVVVDQLDFQNSDTTVFDLNSGTLNDRMRSLVLERWDVLARRLAGHLNRKLLLKEGKTEIMGYTYEITKDGKKAIVRFIDGSWVYLEFDRVQRKYPSMTVISSDDNKDTVQAVRDWLSILATELPHTSIDNSLPTQDVLPKMLANAAALIGKTVADLQKSRKLADEAADVYNAHVGRLFRILHGRDVKDVSPTPAVIPTEASKAGKAAHLKSAKAGELGYLIFGAGRATRMKLPAIFDTLGIAGIVEWFLIQFQRFTPTAKEGDVSDNLSYFDQAISYAQQGKVGASDFDLESALKGLTMVQRQLLQLWYDTVKLANETPDTDVSPEDAVKGLSFTVVVNHSNRQAVQNQLAALNFPGKIKVMEQPEVGGYVINNDGSLTWKDDAVFPEGHGQPFIAMSQTKGHVFELNNNTKEWAAISDTLVNALEKDGVKYFMFAQVNDLHLLHNMASVERWETARGQMEQGAEFVMEMVANTLKQKGGGTFLNQDGFAEMRDTLAMKRPQLESVTTPQSLSRMFYFGRLEALKKVNWNSIPAYLNIREVKGEVVFTRELYSGDASSALKGRTMEQPDVAINTFKDRARAGIAQDAFHKQNDQKDFRDFVKGVLRIAASFFGGIIFLGAMSHAPVAAQDAVKDAANAAIKDTSYFGWPAAIVFGFVAGLVGVYLVRYKLALLEAKTKREVRLEGATSGAIKDNPLTVFFLIYLLANLVLNLVIDPTTDMGSLIGQIGLGAPLLLAVGIVVILIIRIVFMDKIDVSNLVWLPLTTLGVLSLSSSSVSAQDQVARGASGNPSLGISSGWEVVALVGGVALVIGTALLLAVKAKLRSMDLKFRGDEKPELKLVTGGENNSLEAEIAYLKAYLAEPRHSDREALADFLYQNAPSGSVFNTSADTLKDLFRSGKGLLDSKNEDVQNRSIGLAVVYLQKAKAGHAKQDFNVIFETSRADRNGRRIVDVIHIGQLLTPNDQSAVQRDLENLKYAVRKANEDLRNGIEHDVVAVVHPDVGQKVRLQVTAALNGLSNNSGQVNITGQDRNKVFSYKEILGLVAPKSSANSTRLSVVQDLVAERVDGILFRTFDRRPGQFIADGRLASVWMLIQNLTHLGWVVTPVEDVIKGDLAALIAA